VLEVKSVAPSTFKLWQRQRQRFDAFPGWKYQLGAAMLAANLPGLLVVANRLSGLLHHHQVESVSYPSVLELKGRVAAPEAYQRDNHLLPPCPESWNCPFFYTHDHGLHGEGPVLRPNETPEHIRVVLREARRHASGAILERVEERLREVGEL
jgi:hypothetical protein